jgi:hypothetical protein
MFDVGDVVRFHSPTAGKENYHLCLGLDNSTPLFVFLFLNSKAGFKGEYILEDGVIPGLPKSPTDQTVVSFSNLTRIGEERLNKFGAIKTGKIDGHLAGELVTFVRELKVLTRSDRNLVMSALESMYS